MTTSSKNGGQSSPAQRSQVKGKRGNVPQLSLEGTSRDTRCVAAAILEVLAGTRTPSDAAQALGMSVPHYYTVERRALQGLLTACKPQKTGRGHSTESELTRLQRECEQLRRECGRQQALVRAAQRTIGLAAPTPASKPDASGKKHRKRRPTARALKAVAALQVDVPEATPQPTTNVTQESLS